MPPESPQLPPKPEVALALLQTASSIYVHLDPRGEDVFVPAWFKTQAQLVLQVGLNMVVPIPDLDVGQESISCTLSFNRRPEFCRIPWTAIYGLVGEDGRGMIWPESIPAEVASAAQGSPNKRPHLRVAEEKTETPLKAVSARKGSKERVKKANSAETGGEQAATGLAAKAGQPQPKRRASAKKKPTVDGSHTVAEPTTSSSAPRRELPPYLRVVK